MSGFSFNNGFFVGGPPGGANGQVQYNNSGVMGGFTINGDGSLNTASGALTITGTGGVSFGTLATRSTIPQTNLLYVAKNGNDANAGDFANPFLTIGAAITAASSGVTINIAPGTYAENITLKAGVSLQGQQARSTFVTGNMTANFSGTVYLHSLDLQASSGDVLTISGANVLNLSLDDTHIDSLSGAGNCVTYSATNASAKFSADNGVFNVANSAGGATIFTSGASAAGTIIWEDISARVLDNLDHTSLAIGGSVSFTHTFDDVHGQVVVSNSAAYVGTDITYNTTSVAVLTTTSSGLSVLGSDIILTTATPAITGVGGFAYGLLGYTSTGTGFASTLNGGAGATVLPTSGLSLYGGLSLTGPFISTDAGAASTPAMKITGSIFTGGTTTTTKPQLLIEPTGTTSTAWNTSGTLLGGNAPSGFAGKLLDFQVYGSSVFSVAPAGSSIFSSNVQSYGNFIATGNFYSTNVAALFYISDTYLSRHAAANWQLGQADAAAPVAQTLSIQSVVAGTSNTAGVNWTLSGSVSTGSGVSGDIIIQTGGTGAGSTAQNALVTALTIKGATQQAIFSGTVKTLVTTVSGLPSASTTGQGSRAFVTDANTTVILGLGLTVVGGGSNKVPVYSDGTNWIIG